MEKYDVDIKWSVSSVRVKLQYQEYKGYYDIKAKSNIRGRDLLMIVTDTENLEQNQILDSDCEFMVIKSYIEEDSFECTLTSEDGRILRIENYIDELAELIVGCNIIKHDVDTNMANRIR